MKKILLLITLYSSISFTQTLDTIKKIEFYYGKGAQCFPQDGIYANSEKFFFEKTSNGSFELTKHYKFWNTSKQNATVFVKDSSITKLNKKCNNEVLLNLITNLNTDNQNFSYSFLKQRINKPSSNQIKKIAKKIDRFFVVDCDGFFDCEYRNNVIDSIKNFNRFDEYISSMNLTKNQLSIIGAYDFAEITITSKDNITSYVFSFMNNIIGQPITKKYNNKYTNDNVYVNLIANEMIRELLPKNTITYKALDLKKITEDYIGWYLKN